MQHVQNESKISCAGSLGSRNMSILGSFRGVGGKGQGSGFPEKSDSYTVP